VEATETGLSIWKAGVCVGEGEVHVEKAGAVAAQGIEGVATWKTETMVTWDTYVAQDERLMTMAWRVPSL